MRLSSLFLVDIVVQLLERDSRLRDFGASVISPCNPDSHDVERVRGLAFDLDDWAHCAFVDSAPEVVFEPSLPNLGNKACFSLRLWCLHDFGTSFFRMKLD